MTTNSGQARYDSALPQEPIDERRSSGQPASQTVPVSSEQSRTGSAPSASPQDHQQAAVGYEEDGPGSVDYEQDAAADHQQATARRVPQASAGQQQTGAGDETPRPDATLHSERNGHGVNADGATDDMEPALIADPSGYSRRWEAIQVGFVDDPRSAVQQAGTLVSDVVREMTDTFQRQEQRLEEQWSGGNRASTDELRLAFQHYRGFFQRLLRV